ncbi:HAD family hydrolase [Candidatus Proelusimicrobium excrementi]|uniref:HAD family hydrolase n=1 Tax=Candidatus Proelusimicrobium excrementi TaxID=3416222 RepID=UPI003D0B1464
MMRNIKIVAFDADDTLWPNEDLFREAEELFCRLMQPYTDKDKAKEALFSTEINNLPLYGYGIKAFMLSMIETALKLSGGKMDSAVTEQIISTGRAMLNQPVKLLPGALPVFKTLSAKYKLVVATKGDLLDQERKLNKSGLTKYLHHIEIMSEKNIRGYKTLMRRLGVMPQEFLMVGNSLKSDIMPVVKLGARAVWIPYSLTWQHENLATDKLSNGFIKMDKIADLLKIL